MTTATTSRTADKLLADLTKKYEPSYVNFKDGINTREAAFILMAFVLILMAFGGMGAAGYILAYLTGWHELTWWCFLLFGGVSGLLVGGVVYSWLLDAAAPSYEWEGRQEEQKPRGRSFVQSGDNPRRSVSLTEDVKGLLQTFARRYDTVQSLAINRWEGRGQPFSRDEIKQVRRWLVRMGYATRTESGEVLLTDEGEKRLPRWAAGDF